MLQNILSPKTKMGSGAKVNSERRIPPLTSGYSRGFHISTFIFHFSCHPSFVFAVLYFCLAASSIIPRKGCFPVAKIIHSIYFPPSTIDNHFCNYFLNFNSLCIPHSILTNKSVPSF